MKILPYPLILKSMPFAGCFRQQSLDDARSQGIIDEFGNVVIDYNCSAEGKPNWSKYDALEVQPSMKIGDSFKPCSLTEASMLTLSGHFDEGDVEAIHDFHFGEHKNIESISGVVSLIAMQIATEKRLQLWLEY